MTNYCFNISLETIFMNTENSETSGPQKVVLSLPQRLDLRSLNKHVALQNFPICYPWKNVRQQYKNSLRYSRLYWVYHKKTWKMQKNIKQSMKHETWNNNLPNHIYINRINNRLMFKIKDGYKQELRIPETIKLFGSTKKLIEKTKNCCNQKSSS